MFRPLQFIKTNTDKIMYLNSGELPSGPMSGPLERLIASINIGQLFCVHQHAAGGHQVYLGMEQLSTLFFTAFKVLTLSKPFACYF